MTFASLNCYFIATLKDTAILIAGEMAQQLRAVLALAEGGCFVLTTIYNPKISTIYVYF